MSSSTSSLADVPHLAEVGREDRLVHGPVGVLAPVAGHLAEGERAVRLGQERRIVPGEPVLGGKTLDVVLDATRVPRRLQLAHLVALLGHRRPQLEGDEQELGVDLAAQSVEPELVDVAERSSVVEEDEYTGHYVLVGVIVLGAGVLGHLDGLVLFAVVVLGRVGHRSPFTRRC